VFFEKNNYNKKDPFIKFFCFCLKHFLIFLIFSEKTAKNQTQFFYGFYRYFPRSRYLHRLGLFFQQSGPKNTSIRKVWSKSGVGAKRKFIPKRNGNMIKGARVPEKQPQLFRFFGMSLNFWSWLKNAQLRRQRSWLQSALWILCPFLA